MDFTARLPQEIIIGHLLRVDRANVFAGMGMGKTVSTLTALLMKNEMIQECFPTLIVAPKRVALATWPNELSKWNHLDALTCSVLIGTPKQREAALNKKADIYTINYENLPWLIDQCSEGWPFKSIVCDESSKLKSFRTRVKKVNGKMPRKPSRALATVAFKSDTFINLTGTPSPNGIADLWGQQWFIDRGEKLGASFSKFQRKFFRCVQMGGPFRKWEPLDGSSGQIMDLLSSDTVSVQPEQFFNLDQPIVNEIKVDLSKQHFQLYKNMERNLYLEFENEGVEAVNAAVKSIKCLQIASGFVYDEDGEAQAIHTEKLEALQSIVNEVDEPLLVAYHWKPDIEAIKRKFPDAEVLGSDPSIIDRWNRGEIKMLLAQPASAGHGLNLQDGGRAIVFYSNWWSLEEYQQIIERIGPMRQKQAGHNRSVLIYHILTSNTLDQAVLERLESKASVQQAILNHRS